MNTDSRENTHYFWFDWIRFLSAFMVVAIHARGGLWTAWIDLENDSKSAATAIFYALTRAGTEWVLVFFVLSGFLVGGRVAEKAIAGEFDVYSYGRDRITRIMVPLIPTLIWSGAIALYLGREISLLSFFGNLIGLQGVFVYSFGGNVPLWSLAYEIWFYLLAGAVACLPGASGVVRIAAILTILTGFAVFTKLDPVFLFAWLIGAISYFLNSKEVPAHLFILGVLFAALGYIFSQLTSATISVDLNMWLPYSPSNAVAILVLATGIALILPFVSGLKPSAGLSTRIEGLGTTLAASSYTLYLTHYPMLYLWDHFMPHLYSSMTAESIAVYLLRIISCIAVAWLFYLPFEKQTHKLRRYFAIR